MSFGGDARQAPRQHAPGLRPVAYGKHAQHGRARHDGVPLALSVPGRHLRQRQVALHGEGAALAFDAAAPLLQRGARERAAQHRAIQARRARPGGADDAVRQARQCIAQRGVLAAPPGGQRGQAQFLAQQVLRECGQKAQQRAGFEKRRARRVGHQHMARADGLQQPRHAQPRVAAQLQRVEEFVVQALQDAVHRLQAVQRAQEQPVAAHGEVAALDQRQAQVAREVGVLEVGLVVRAGGQQHDARILPLGAHGAQVGQQRVVGGRQALHPHLAEGLGEQARDEQPVFQQVAQARGRLRALAHHPPVAACVARHVERGDVQVRAAHGPHAVQRAQVAGVAVHQRAGQQAGAQQRLGAVAVGHHRVEQARALARPGFDALPVAGCEQQREQIDRPGPLRAVGVGIDVVGDAVVAHLALQAVHAPVHVTQAGTARVMEKFGPIACQASAGSYRFRSVFSPCAAAQFVEMPRRSGCGQGRGQGGRAVGVVGVHGSIKAASAAAGRV